MTQTAEDIATLEAKAAAAYERAQMAAAEARQAELDRQNARAREDFARVFIDSPIGQAWVAVQLAGLRHAHAAVDVNSAASQVGQPSKNLSRPATNAIVEQLAQMVDTAAADAIAAELQARDAERAAYIAGEQGCAHDTVPLRQRHQAGRAMVPGLGIHGRPSTPRPCHCGADQRSGTVFPPQERHQMPRDGRESVQRPKARADRLSSRRYESCTGRSRCLPDLGSPATPFSDQ